MRLKYHLTTLYIMAAAVLCVSLFGGCTKENNTNCGIAVRFKYDKNVDWTNKFGSQVYHIDLYIFDENNVFLESHTVQASQLSGNNAFLPNDYVMKLTHLKPGTYTLVAWGNMNNLLTTTPLAKTSSFFSSSILSLITEDNGKASRTENLSLFHGWIGKLEVGKDVVGTQEVLIDLLKFSNKIVVTMTGLPVDNVNNLPVECIITSKNGSYRFDGNFASDDMITYHPYPMTVEPNKSIVATFNILREISINDPTDARLLITYKPLGSETKILVDEPLVELLKRLAGIKNTPNEKNTGDLDIDDLHYIDVDFDFTSTTVSVLINGWQGYPNEIYL